MYGIAQTYQSSNFCLLNAVNAIPLEFNFWSQTFDKLLCLEKKSVKVLEPPLIIGHTISIPYKVQDELGESAHPINLREH